ncbi:MAG: TRAP transporter substrate-binding protein DctP [Planctomycetes bacterium]|nr:TRAP transporter substrate-binding protein DctP [Planctomycetota bacterium]MCW8141730.1 TRAP transporter substrate-binding protein DctP [Planctomycetota bacterium]
MRARKLGLAALVAAGTFAATPGTDVAAQQRGVTLRIATQAPDGTVWMDALNDIQREIDRGTKGRVAFQFFPNGSQGDEKAVIERMQVGLLHGGLFTGIGLGEILPKVRILEMPFLYRNKEEIDAVKAALEEELRAGFEERGFVFLGWAEVGWAYIFSKQEARNLAELRQRKIWVWQGDPLAERTFQVFGLAGTPLPLTDVLTSLETGMIDSVYNSPYGLVGLQWHRNVRYMSRMTVGHGTGALLVSKSEWEKIPPAVRGNIAAACRRRLDALLTEVGAKNEQTVTELQQNGTTIIPIPEEEMPQYLKFGEQVAEQMAGVLYDKALLERVRGILRERRAGGR